MGTLKDRSSPHREVEAAGVTAVKTVLSGLHALDFPTLWAGRTIRPAATLEVCSTGIRIWKHAEEFKRADGRLVAHD